jgi:3-hydroxyisobutyrate dehydrogenase-like beta-hydroxyacid dehydrogenase
MATPDIGFVGVGQMGQSIARNLLKAGHALRVFDIHEERAVSLIAAGAKQVSDLRSVAMAGGIVLSMVPDDQALLSIALSEEGLLRQLGKGGVHLSLSTVSPATSQQLAKLYREQGSTFLVATVLGRPEIAEKAALSIFLSGERDAKERVIPLLQVIGKHIYDLGEQVADANVYKLAANFLILAALEAMGEAAAFVQGYGADRALFMRMMVESPLFAGAVYEGYGTMIGAQDYSDARFPVPMGLKDAALVLQAAELISHPMPLARLAQQHLLDAETHDRAGEDWSVLAEYATSAPIPVAGD